ncbi:MAG: hypothetical protein EOO04_27310 [Chitinophagaceae bacterium]|nr:MAG: hypothetical protein EOO04_27310 [Chitinophagaceae bacterium]
MSVQTHMSRRIFPQSTRDFESNALHRIATTLIPLHSNKDHHPAASVSIRDYTLAPKQQLFEPCLRHSNYTIIPVVGTLNYSLCSGMRDCTENYQDVDDNNLSSFVCPGETLEFCGCNTAGLTFCNPFDTELINFIVIETTDFPQGSPQGSNTEWIESAPDTLMKTLVPVKKNIQEAKTNFDINAQLNSLVPVKAHPSGYRLLIGKFGGREDYIFTPTNIRRSVILYVIEGAFEAAECLLEDRDALLLTGLAHVEFEALSNNAIVLIIELPQQVG